MLFVQNSIFLRAVCILLYTFSETTEYTLVYLFILPVRFYLSYCLCAAIISNLQHFLHDTYTTICDTGHPNKLAKKAEECVNFTVHTTISTWVKKYELSITIPIQSRILCCEKKQTVVWIHAEYLL